MDVRLIQIASKAAGTYFIVSDKSAVPTIEAESKLRVIFINSEQGPTNVLVKFAKGDTTSLHSMFGKATRAKEKRGNFSIKTCEDALIGGPIGVINLRAYDSELDLTTVSALNPNVNDPESLTTPYISLFNANGYWSAKPKQMNDVLTQTHLLNFGAVGNSDLSIFVTKAKDVSLLTYQGDETLESCSLDIEDFDGLDFNSYLKDNFVDVYVFKNNFDPATSNTNQYYGHLFDNNGNVDLNKLDDLANINESGFIRKVTGSLIPGLKSEANVDISIDTIINQYYPSDGLICDIDEDALEVNSTVIDMEGVNFFDENNDKVAETSDYLLSHVVPVELTTDTNVWPLTNISENVEPDNANLITYTTEKVDSYSFLGSFEQGLRIDDVIEGVNGNVKIESMVVLDDNAVIGATEDTYTKVKYICSGPVLFGNADTTIVKKNLFVDNSLVKPTILVSYKPRTAQFTDGSSSKQSEILDMMNHPSIVKGLRGTKGIAYVIDAFKSFVESSYKYQYGNLMVTLDNSNKFVRAILNEPSVEDMQKSTNPLFADLPGGTFDWSYVPDGGNKNYSSKLLIKFSAGESFCFFYGCDNLDGNVIKPIAGLVSNLFYNKSLRFDIVANETGYIDGLTEVINEPDDLERAFCEKFRYNPIININGGYTIYGNLTGQKKVTKQQQIHNSELLAYIKENLFNLAKGDAFKRATYDNYLKTETETKSFMEALVLSGAIEPDPVVQCDAENNTTEISNYKIKLVHVEYKPLDSLEKIVFDLNIY